MLPVVCVSASVVQQIMQVVTSTFRGDQAPVSVSVLDLVVRFSRQISTCQRAIASAHQDASTALSSFIPEEQDVKQRYAQLLDEFQAVADRCGVRVPYQIRFHQWWKSRAALEAEGEDDPPLLSQSLGMPSAHTCIHTCVHTLC